MSEQELKEHKDLVKYAEGQRLRADDALHLLAASELRSKSAQARITELEEENARLLNLQKSNEFWSQIVYPEGLTAEVVRNELADYHQFMSNGAIVYCHATRGRISKINTDPSVVCSVIDDVISKDINIYVEEARNDAIDDCIAACEGKADGIECINAIEATKKVKE